MGTTDKLNYLLETKEAIKGAIKAKGVSVADSDTFRSYADKIGNIGGLPYADVRLFDVEGNLLYTYTKDEFLNLTEWPPHSQHPYVGSWGSLDDAKTIVDKCGFVDIGEGVNLGSQYDKILHISVTDELSQTLTFSVLNFGDYVKVDWGDGNVEIDETNRPSDTTYTKTHTYEAYGDYVVRITTYNDSVSISDNYSIKKAFGSIYIQKANRMEILNGGGASSCPLLRILINSTVASGIGCPSLEIVANTTGLEVTSSYFGDRYFNGTKLDRVIAKLATDSDSITNRGMAFNTNLRQFVTISHYPVGRDRLPYLGNGAFQGCVSLLNYDLQGVKNLGESAFEGCTSLNNIVIPQTITTIYNYVFRGCASLTEINLPATIQSIGVGAFAFCPRLKKVDCADMTSIPTLSYDVFLNTDCKIVVPDALYDSWIAASNWSTYASQIVKASEYNG